MKIAHIADIHIGVNELIEPALERLSAELNKRSITRIVIAGDIFEGVSTPAHRLTFQRFIDSLPENSSVVVVRGNHDRKDDLLLWNGYISARGTIVEVHERPGMTRPFSPRLCVHTIPHFSAGAVALESDSREDLDATGTDLFSQILDDLYQTIKAQSESQHIVVAHATVSGARLDSGRIPLENGIHLPLGKLEILGCPVMLGHYHKPQALDVAGLVRYPGSIERNTFGEAEDDKGFLIWTLDGDSWSAEFVSLGPAPMITFESSFENGVWTHDSLPPASKEARVRFRFTVAEDQLPHLDLSQIRRQYADVRELKIERIVETQTAVRDQQITQAETVEDSLRVWMSSRGMTDEEIELHIQEFRATIQKTAEEVAA